MKNKIYKTFDVLIESNRKYFDEARGEDFLSETHMYATPI